MFFWGLVSEWLYDCCLSNVKNENLAAILSSIFPKGYLNPTGHHWDLFWEADSAAGFRNTALMLWQDIGKAIRISDIWKHGLFCDGHFWSSYKMDLQLFWDFHLAVNDIIYLPIIILMDSFFRQNSHWAVLALAILLACVWIQYLLFRIRPKVWSTGGFILLCGHIYLRRLLCSSLITLCSSVPWQKPYNILEIHLRMLLPLNAYLLSCMDKNFVHIYQILSWRDNNQ